MKIIYIVNTRIPTEKAHGYQISRVCSGLAKQNYEVELWLPYRNLETDKNIFEYYNLPVNFTVKKLGFFDFFKLEKLLTSKISFLLQSLYFSLVVFLEKISLPKDTIIITRNPEIVWLLGNNFKVFYNAHNWPKKFNLLIWLVKKSKGIICNSKGTESKFKQSGFKNTIALPNGVDLEYFDFVGDKNNLRQELGLPIKDKIIMYTGHLYDWKGIDVLIEAAFLNNDSSIKFVIVGGTKGDVEKYRQIIFKKDLSNVILVGHVQKNIIPKYLKSADFLILPNIPINEESEKYTSPIKLFEYMASGVPIIASCLPSITEVLNKENSILIEPGDSLAINKIINSEENFISLANHAKKDVLNYTWDVHLGKLIKFLKCVD